MGKVVSTERVEILWRMHLYLLATDPAYNKFCKDADKEKVKE